MVRVKGYAVLKSLAGTAARGAGDATAMLVSGKRRLDVELRRLRGEAEAERLTLSELLLGGGLPACEQALMLRLAGELCEVLECALEAAILLRGRCVRAWGIFDRVRVSAALTERLRGLVDQLGNVGERALQSAVRDFHEISERLSALGLRSFEDILSGTEQEAVLLLSGVLDRWRSAAGAAYSTAVSLVCAR